jgi:hypothetical protein
VLGWRLHLFDLATNKAMALASRSVTRNYVDIVERDGVYPLEAIVWAACGKDQGFRPMLLLEMMRRFARINPRQLESIQTRQLDPVALKRDWIAMSDRADAEITPRRRHDADNSLGGCVCGWQRIARLDREGFHPADSSTDGPGVLAAGGCGICGGLKSFPSGIKLDRNGEAGIEKMQSRHVLAPVPKLDADPDGSAQAKRCAGNHVSELLADHVPVVVRQQVHHESHP